MKKLTLAALALLGLGSVVPDARASTKSSHSNHMQDSRGPFTDVPVGHWAYSAVQKVTQQGFLQGWDNRFFGEKALSRYQMAIVVSRMLDQLHMLKKDGRVFTAEDISNLEALTIEFADELALLNVKVADLEKDVDGLLRDVERMKFELGPKGPRAPFTGLVSTRFVTTASATPGYGQSYNNGSNSTNIPQSAATPAMLRYRGDVTGPVAPVGRVPAGQPGIGTATNPFQFEDRAFFTVAQFSVNADREINENISLHAQVDINAESDDGIQALDLNSAAGAPVFTSAQGNGSFDQAPGGFLPNNQPSDTFYYNRIFDGSVPGIPVTGPFQTGSGRGQSFRDSNLHINEAYIEFHDWLGQVNGRLGTFATPFNTEVNGPSRTYNWTLTPTVANTFWESLRPVGVEVRESTSSDYWHYNVGLFSGVDQANGATLMSGIQGPRTGNAGLLQGGIGVLVGTGLGGPGDIAGNNAGPQDPFGNTTLTGSITGEGRLPTPRNSVMTDVAQGVSSQVETDHVGWYARVGGQKENHKGFGWQIGFMDNGGDLARGQDESGTLSDWHAWQTMANYTADRWLVMAQYYNGTTRNYTEIDLAPSAANVTNFLETDPRFKGSPFPNAWGQNTSSYSLSGMVSYAWNDDNALTFRFEHATDRTGLAQIIGSFYTFAYSRRTSEAGRLQLELITPDTYTVADNGSTRDTDINDDLLQVNYRLAF